MIYFILIQYFFYSKASSPDELALVKFANSLNMKLLCRDEEKIII